MTRHRWTGLRSLLAIVATLLALPTGSGRAEAPPFAGKVAKKGFGEAPANRFSCSMAWFKGKLYVGTGREELRIEPATTDCHGRATYNEAPAPDISCRPDRYDLRLRAELWRFTPSTRTRELVYRSPQDIPNARAPGKFVARDIGFRGMVVRREPDGSWALSAWEAVTEHDAQDAILGLVRQLRYAGSAGRSCGAVA